MKALCLSVFSLALDISGLLPPARAAVLAAVCSSQLWACQGCLLLLTAHLLSVCDFGPVFAVLVSLLTLLTRHRQTWCSPTSQVMGAACPGPTQNCCKALTAAVFVGICSFVERAQRCDRARGGGGWEQ